MMYYKCSRSDIKGEGGSMKTSSDHQVIAAPFQKLGSLNLMAAFWLAAHS